MSLEILDNALCKVFEYGNPDTNKKFTFIDLFAGIGGFHIALSELGGECVFAAEIDNHARKTYKENLISEKSKLNKNFVKDITKVNTSEIPNFDVLCAGFPCQPFSQAGFKKGFSETRGTLFFNIVEIIKDKQPQAFFLENVRHLSKHDEGRTFETIKRVLTEELGYSFYYSIVKASDFGLPQHRPRLFMVGFKDTKLKFEFPRPLPLKKNMSDIFGGKCNKEIGFTLRVGGRGSGISDRRNWDTYLVDDKIVRLSSLEGLKLQGFPKNFKFTVSETQAMKQLGNSVAVPAIKAVAKNLVDLINENI